MLCYAGLLLLGRCVAVAAGLVLLPSHAPLPLPGGPPKQTILGYEARGWRHVRHTLLRLVSPWHMHRSDAYLVRRAVERREEEAAQEAAAAADAAEALSCASRNAGDKAAVRMLSKLLSSATAAAAAAAVQGAGDEAEAAAPLPLDSSSSSSDGDDETGASASPGAKASGDKYADCAVLPWWLLPEDIPPEVSPEWGRSGVVSGRSCVTSRKRALATTAAGQPVWEAVGQYAVLYTVAGPPATW